MKVELCIPDAIFTPKIDALVTNCLITQFGGFTVSRANGVWADDDDVVIAEPVRHFWACTTQRLTESQFDAVRELAKDILRYTGERSVFYAIDGVAYYENKIE